MNWTSKFDKRRCRSCIYHGKIGEMIHCNYTNEERGSVLRLDLTGKLIDLRGEDKKNCRLRITKKEKVNRHLT